MNIHIISIFPEIFESFTTTSLLNKAIESWLLSFHFTNPRDFTHDKHRQIDDEIYWGGAGMLMKAQPMIDALEYVISNIQNQDFNIIMPAPSSEFFDQKKAFDFAKTQNLIFICGRYEGIDHRFEQYVQKKYMDKFQKISIGKYITMWWEIPAMTMIESIIRLVPWVLGSTESVLLESYSPDHNLKNIESPQYTRPECVQGMSVPEVLLSWNHSHIQQRKDENEKSIEK